MKREILDNLVLWKQKENRKPLILKGARQVGKSYIVKFFAQEYFANFLRIDFLADKKVHSVFADNESLVPSEIIKRLSFYYEKPIVPEKTLIFFDEIQECPNALKSLKFFAESASEFYIIGAGSYLGIMVNESSYPVGKVEFLKMYPMNFKEFLEAYNSELSKIYDEISIEVEKLIPISKIYHESFLEAWIYYQMIGGMPEVVQTFILLHKDNLFEACQKAREIQLQLLIGHKADFSKHAGTVNATHILNVFENVSTQLGQVHDESVKKFQFSGVIPNKKGFESIRNPLTWLEKSHLLLRSFIVKKSEHPLKANIQDNQFKLYYFDIGLLNAELNIPVKALMTSMIGSYKGFIAENFVMQELISTRLNEDIYCWQETKAEVEFLIVKNADIIPIEVKSSEKFSRAKSLDSYIERYRPELAIKLSPKNIGYDQSKKMLSLPIYLAGKL